MKKQTIYLLLNISFIITLLGAFFNGAVVLNNNCEMPVYDKFNIYNGSIDNRHIAYNDFKQVKYPFYSDIIKVYGNIFSIGDFLMFFGLISLFFFTFILIIKAFITNPRINN